MPIDLVVWPWHTIGTMPRTTEFDRLIARGTRRRELPTADRLRALREAVGVSQADQARALGVSASCVSRWEAGLRVPRGEVRDRYLDLLAKYRAALAE